MSRRTPDDERAVIAISDARRNLYRHLASDGELCQDDHRALMLLDTAAYHAVKAKWNRKAAQSFESNGEIVPTLLRERHEIERDYRHVLPFIADEEQRAA